MRVIGQIKGEGNSAFYPKTHLKGYKMSVKDFRNNILLKTRGTKNTNKKQSSIHSSPRRIKTESTIVSPRIAPLRSFSRSRVHQILHQKQDNLLSKNICELINDRIEEDRRMAECISIFLKKKDEEDQKQMQKKLQNEEKKRMEKLTTPLKNSNYCRRLKAHSFKIRNKISRLQSLSQIQTQNDQDANYQQMIQKIKKTSYHHQPKKMVKSSLSLSRSKSPFSINAGISPN